MRRNMLSELSPSGINKPAARKFESSSLKIAQGLQQGAKVFVSPKRVENIVEANGLKAKAVPKPNQPPHAPYSETYLLPTTKYGRPVVPEMFVDNLIQSPNLEPDPPGRWWEAILTNDRINQRIERLSAPNDAHDIPRSQRYFPISQKELIGYQQWTLKVKVHEAAKVEELKVLVAKQREEKAREVELQLQQAKKRASNGAAMRESWWLDDLASNIKREERLKLQCVVAALRREEMFKKDLELKQLAVKRDPKERMRMAQEHMWKRQAAEYELQILRGEKERLLKEQKECAAFKVRPQIKHKRSCGVQLRLGGLIEDKACFVAEQEFNLLQIPPRLKHKKSYGVQLRFGSHFSGS